MYHAHVSLRYGLTGQTIEFYPPAELLVQAGAPATAATYQVWRSYQSNDDTPILSGTATLDPVDTTTDDICGVDSDVRSLIPLAATTDIVRGYRYLLSDSRVTIVTPVSITDGDSIQADQDLLFNFASGSTFKGLRHSFIVDSSFVHEQQNINIGGFQLAPYRIYWTITYADNSVHVHVTTFDLVRSPLGHSVTVETLKPLVPDIIWKQWSQQDGLDFQPQIQAAYDQLVFDVRMAGYRPDMVEDPQIVDYLIKHASLAIIFGGLGESSAETYTNKYNVALGKALNAKTWMQQDQTGRTNPIPRAQPMLKR
jgi:hypothetical protein